MTQEEKNEICLDTLKIMKSSENTKFGLFYRQMHKRVIVK